MDLFVASRICAAAHGGQVVVSRMPRHVVGDADPSFSSRPLGSHRLKDVPGSEQLFQLVAAGLQEGFAPVAHALRLVRGPRSTTAWLAAAGDLTSTLSLLARADVRLVTPSGSWRRRQELVCARGRRAERDRASGAPR